MEQTERAHRLHERNPVQEDSGVLQIRKQLELSGSSRRQVNIYYKIQQVLFTVNKVFDIGSTVKWASAVSTPSQSTFLLVQYNCEHARLFLQTAKPD